MCVKQWLPDEEVAFLVQAVAFPNEVEEFYNDILVLRRDSVSPNDLAKVSLNILHTCPIYALKMFLCVFPAALYFVCMICFQLFSLQVFIRLRNILFCSTVKWW